MTSEVQMQATVSGHEVHPWKHNTESSDMSVEGVPTSDCDMSGTM